MKFLYSKNEVFHHEYIKIIRYNDTHYKLIQFKHSVRKPGFEEEKTSDINLPTYNPDLIHDEEYLRQSVSRTKKTIFEYALCNDFEFFITLTFDRVKYNARDLVKLKKQVGQWLNNYKKRKNKDLKYILIPELHKDKTHFHFHGLISGINDITEFRTTTKGIMRYNWTSWAQKFGYTSLEKIDYLPAISKYITKYIYLKI